MVVTLIPSALGILLPSLIAAGGGLIVGSAITAAVPRLRSRDAGFFTGRSQCPHCGTALTARDLMPVLSYLLSRGHCQHCGTHIPAHYPITELVTALSFGLSTFFVGTGDAALLAWHLVFVAVMIFLSLYDWLYGEIPDEVSLPAASVALAGSLLAFTLSWQMSLAGALASGGFFFALVFLSRGRWMGGGDIRLGLLLGAWLGPVGVGIAIFGASLVGTVLGGGLQLAGKLGKKAAVPFAPLLFVGTMIALLWGADIASWYLSQLYY